MTDPKLSEQLLDIARVLRWLDKTDTANMLIGVAFFLERNRIDRVEDLKDTLPKCEFCSKTKSG